MTPGARVAASIEILDEIEAGRPAEQALTRWARRSRFAGSKDRRAIRGFVFDALRTRSLAAHVGNGVDGRAVMIGLLRLQESDLDVFFTGEGYAPAPLTEAEREAAPPPSDPATRWALPDWMVSQFVQSLGTEAEAAALALQERAPVTLRVNLAKTTRQHVQDLLLADGIRTKENPLARTALTVDGEAPGLRNVAAYRDGLIELQDASSQAVAMTVPVAGRVLDYCAGGGGKTLALAALGATDLFAHDRDPGRMSDLPARSARAGARVTTVPTQDLPKQPSFDAVLCDAPCSGSGAWRRAPEGKWRLTPERLSELTQIQDAILDQAAQLTAATGTVVFATCSVFQAENEDRIAAFLSAHPTWVQTFSRRFDISPEGDGFFVAHLRRDLGERQTILACKIILVKVCLTPAAP